MTTGTSRLADFGRRVLMILEEDTDWNGDTFDRIQLAADTFGFHGEKDGHFKALLPRDEALILAARAFNIRIDQTPRLGYADVDGETFRRNIDDVMELEIRIAYHGHVLKFSAPASAPAPSEMTINDLIHLAKAAEYEPGLLLTLSRWG